VDIRLAGVFAHPDDDSYVIGGSLLLNPDVDLTLVFATNGGAGPISDPALASRETLGRVREGEQAAWLQAVGFGGARVEWLGHPDYYLPDVPLERLSADIEAILLEAQPHIVVTFGPDGLTSHHDHIRVGEAATQAFHRVRDSATDSTAFQRLYHAVLPRSDVDRFYAGVEAGRHEYGVEGNLFDITGVPDETIAVRVDTRAVRDRKWSAILEHQTQMGEHERIPEPLRWIVLDSESFQQAFPEPGPGGVRSDLFGDLESSARETEGSSRA
jgi:LmbE family N-acetylglucosaminyl deacetylase